MSNVHHFHQQRQEQSRAAKAALRTAEQQHWETLVERVNEPEVARLIVRFLDRAPSEKLKQPGLYLRARLVLKDDFARGVTEARQARQRKVQVLVKSVVAAGCFIFRCGRLLVRAIRNLVLLLVARRSGDRPLFHH